MAFSEGRSIARADLLSESSPSQPPSPIEASYLEKLSEAFGDVREIEEYHNDTSKATDVNEEDDTVEFRLFAKSGPAEAVPQRIALKSPTPTSQEPSFTPARRPHSYYFTGPPTPEQALRYQRSAISASDILAGLNTKWKGCELPWRVTVIRVSAPKDAQTLRCEEPRAGNKRTRKGKKTRIAIRKRTAEANKLQAQQQMSQKEKKEAEKEKRNRRNREKKVKRRQKMREAKAVKAYDTG